MENINSLPSGIKAVFTDLDDTLTSRGKMNASTYSSLFELKRRGILVIIVSGRPAGWAECLVRLWPIDWMIFENGAGLMKLEGDRVVAQYLAGRDDLSAQRARLQKHFDVLKKRIPKLKLSTDQPYRLYDFAIDYAEDQPFLAENEWREAMDYLKAQKDLTVKLSSIHINYWCGEHTKVSACQWLLTNELAKLSKREIVFCGDSPNDEPLFSFFDNSVGVANVRKFLSEMKSPPKYVTAKECGEGFEELVKAIS